MKCVFNILLLHNLNSHKNFMGQIYLILYYTPWFSAFYYFYDILAWASRHEIKKYFVSCKTRVVLQVPIMKFTNFTNKTENYVIVAKRELCVGLQIMSRDCRVTNGWTTGVLLSAEKVIFSFVKFSTISSTIKYKRSLYITARFCCQRALMS